MTEDLYIFIRKTEDWASIKNIENYKKKLRYVWPFSKGIDADNLRKVDQFLECIDFWNKNLNLTYFEYRNELKKISQSTWEKTGIPVLSHPPGRKIYDENIIRSLIPKQSRPKNIFLLPTDDDDWYAPDIREHLINHKYTSKDTMAWGSWVLFCNAVGWGGDGHSEVRWNNPDDHIKSNAYMVKISDHNKRCYCDKPLHHVRQGQCSDHPVEALRKDSPQLRKLHGHLNVKTQNIIQQSPSIHLKHLANTWQLLNVSSALGITKEVKMRQNIDDWMAAIQDVRDKELKFEVPNNIPSDCQWAHKYMVRLANLNTITMQKNKKRHML
jgi:hypothetical protein